MQDYLSIFDGKSSELPELARVCGGFSLPDIISSGPDMLIVFQTSPFDSLFHPIPVSYLLGFELQVEVSERSVSFSRENIKRNRTKGYSVRVYRFREKLKIKPKFSRI